MSAGLGKTNAPAPSSRSPAQAAKRPFWQPALYWFSWSCSLLFATVFYRMRRFGFSQVPARGPALLVANHQSHLDPPLIASAIMGRQLHFIARLGLFSSPAFAALIRGLNSIPVREDGEADTGAIREALARLEQGELLLIFPEGSRSPDGAVHEFLRGAALLVKRAKCPVIPVAIEGAFDAWPRTRGLPHLWGKRVALSMGRPIGHDELLALGSDAAMTRLRDEIEQLRQGLRRRLHSATRGR